MTFATLAADQEIPTDGEFEIVDGAKRYAVVHHPRIPGYWMVFTPRMDWRDAGMKKCATRAAAVRRLLKARQLHNNR